MFLESLVAVEMAALVLGALWLLGLAVVCLRWYVRLCGRLRDRRAGRPGSAFPESGGFGSGSVYPPPGTKDREDGP